MSAKMVFLINQVMSFIQMFESLDDVTFVSQEGHFTNPPSELNNFLRREFGN